MLAKAKTLVKDLERFCKSLGGMPEKTAWDFGCIVNPEKVFENWNEFLELLEKAKDNPELHAIYFGREDAYIFYHPERAMGGFRLTKYIPEILEDEEMADLHTNVESEFWKHMRSKGIEPEFQFIPRVDVGEWEGKTYIDVEAEVTQPELSDLKRIAKAMLNFKRKLNGLIQKY